MSALTVVSKKAADRQAHSDLFFPVLVTATLLACVVPLAAVIARSGARDTIVLALLLAAVPVGPLVWVLLWLDRYDPEPRTLIASALGWGAVVATLASLRLGGIGQVVLSTSLSLPVVVVTPLVEEATKGLFLCLMLWLRRTRIDGVLDGIVYAGLSGVGFAFVENVLYLMAAYNHGGGDGSGGYKAITVTFIVRCLASPFAHPMFTICTGIGAGLAVSSRRTSVRIWAPVLGFTASVALHSLWNRSALAGQIVFTWAILMIPALVGLIVFAFWVRRQEGTMLRHTLEGAAESDLFAPETIDWVACLHGRRRYRQMARHTGGLEAEQAMRRYQQIAVEYGFFHRLVMAGRAPRNSERVYQSYLTRLERLRSRLTCLDVESHAIQWAGFVQ